MPYSGFCHRSFSKMATKTDHKDFGPLVGAIDQGTSSSRFLVSNKLMLTKMGVILYHIRSATKIISLDLICSGKLISGQPKVKITPRKHSSLRLIYNAYRVNTIFSNAFDAAGFCSYMVVLKSS